MHSKNPQVAGYLLSILLVFVRRRKDVLKFLRRSSVLVRDVVVTFCDDVDARFLLDAYNVLRLRADVLLYRRRSL